MKATLFLTLMLFGLAMSAKVPTKFLMKGLGQETDVEGEPETAEGGRRPNGPQAGGPGVGFGEGEGEGPPGELREVHFGAINGIFMVDDTGDFKAKLSGHFVPDEEFSGLMAAYEQSQFDINAGWGEGNADMDMFGDLGYDFDGELMDIYGPEFVEVFADLDGEEVFETETY